MRKYLGFYDLRNKKGCFVSVRAENLEQAISFCNAKVVENGDYSKITKKGIQVVEAN